MKKGFEKLNEVKNDIDNIEDIKLNGDEKMAMKRRALENIKKFKAEEKREKKGGNKKKLAGGLIIACLGLIICTNETVIAGAQKLGKSIESFFMEEEDAYKDYKKVVLKEVEDKGIKVSLYEAMIDDEEIYISMKVDSKNYKDGGGSPTIIPKNTNIKVSEANGKTVEITGNGMGFQYNEEDKTVDIIGRVDIKELDLSKEITIDVDIEDMVDQENGHENIVGNWDFSFKLDGKAMAKEMRVININKEIEIKEGGFNNKIKLNEIRISPISMRFNYKEEEGSNNHNRQKWIGFKFYDENGKEIDFRGAGGNQDKMTYKWQIDRDVKEIKIVPTIQGDYMIFDRELQDKAITIKINK